MIPRKTPGLWLHYLRRTPEGAQLWGPSSGCRANFSPGSSGSSFCRANLANLCVRSTEQDVKQLLHASTDSTWIQRIQLYPQHYSHRFLVTRYMLHFPTGSNWPGVWERRFCEQISISRLPSGRAGGFAKRGGGHGPQETARYSRLRDLQILSLKNTIYPLVMTNIAVEHGPFIDGFTY